MSIVGLNCIQSRECVLLGQACWFRGGVGLSLIFRGQPLTGVGALAPRWLRHAARHLVEELSRGTLSVSRFLGREDGEHVVNS